MSENNFTINDLLLSLKTLENNRLIKPTKNLTLQCSLCHLTKAIVESIVLISGHVLITEDGVINEENVNHLYINGFLTFPIVKNNFNEWCDIVICTKKGEIRMS